MGALAPPPNLDGHLLRTYDLLPHSAPSWISSYAENLASFSLQDGATTWHYYLKEFISTCSGPCASLPTRSTTFNASTIDFFSCLNGLKCVKQALNRFPISRELLWSKTLFEDMILIWFGWWYGWVWSQPKLSSN